MDSKVELELNKKLAEWRWGKDNLEVSNDGRFIYYHTTWNEGDQEWNIEPVPDFPNDISVCFKWLVPDNCSVCFNHANSSVVCMLTIPRVKGYGSNIYVGKAEDKEDALALCRAIEKLMDGEKGDITND